MNQFYKYILCCLFIAGIASGVSAQTNPKKKDSVPKKNDSIKLKYNFKHNQTGGLLLKYPSKIEVTASVTIIRAKI